MEFTDDKFTIFNILLIFLLNPSNRWESLVFVLVEVEDESGDY